MTAPTRQMEMPLAERSWKDGRPLRAVSLGGGVQSSVMAVMADRGLLGPVPDMGIYADTGWDPPSTAEMIQWLSERLSYPVEKVKAGDLAEDTANGRNARGLAFYTIPAHLTNSRTGKPAMPQRRQCTADYKIAPIIGHLRGVLQNGSERIRPRAAETWLGLTTDEIHRVKPGRSDWLVRKWPLIDMGMSRGDCERWWKANAPRSAPVLRRSACVGCPYHSGAEWAALSREYPEEVEAAAEIERKLQQAVSRDRPGDPVPWLHSRRMPLLEAVELDLRKARNEAGQAELDLWGSECDGMCGM